MAKFLQGPSTSTGVVERDDRICVICRKVEKNEIMYGEFLYYNPIHFHYFCLTSSSFIPQKAPGNSEILGYRYVDVIRGVKDSSESSCYICFKSYASIKCAHSGCERKFHYPCGVKFSCLMQFADAFNGFCENHVPDPNKGKIADPKQNCCCCYEPLQSKNPVDVLISNCCLDTDNYQLKFCHKKCILSYTKQAGYDSTCLTCQTLTDKSSWHHEMAMKGIYVPLQMATWERDGSFSDQVKRRCVEENCTKTHQLTTVYTCFACGCFPKHLSCAKVKSHEEYFCVRCYDQSFVQRIPTLLDD